MDLRDAEIEVFVPYLEHDGVLESSDYDLDWYHRELSEQWFGPLGLPYTWRAVTIDTAEEVAESVVLAQREKPRIVFNLCDGTDGLGDDYPGASVVRALERRGLAYTGADAAFYDITTSKTAHKQRLVEAGVPTSPFAKIVDPRRDIPEAARRIGFPLLIKPEVSSSANGITGASVVHDEASAVLQAERLIAGADGSHAGQGGVFVERFLEGREFTVFVVADRQAEGGATALPPVECVYRDGVARYERLKTQFPEGERFWETLDYEPAPAAVQPALSALACRAFSALAGRGYARIDMRGDGSEGGVFILEVNANPYFNVSLESSLGWILKHADQPIHEVVEKILQDAVLRAEVRG